MVMVMAWSLVGQGVDHGVVADAGGHDVVVGHGVVVVMVLAMVLVVVLVMMLFVARLLVMEWLLVMVLIMVLVVVLPVVLGAKAFSPFRLIGENLLIGSWDSR